MREVIPMALNQKCPKCGSTHVQLSNIESKHGCFWFILFGWIYLIWILIKWCIGIMEFRARVMSGRVNAGFLDAKRLTIAMIVPITLRVNSI